MPTIAEPSPDAISHAVERLRAGRLAVFPTETVYGLGADTFNTDALERIYALKGRPADNPLIAHVAGAEQAWSVTTGWDDRCAKLAERYWPGPLTLIVPRAAHVPAAAAAGLDTLAVRAPRHPVAQDLLDAFGGPISAPSANRSGMISPTSARHVADDYPDASDLFVLDGGPCEVGLESTVLDLTGDTPRLLRKGGVTAQELESILGPIEIPTPTEQGMSPGMTLRHYAPKTPAVLVDPDALDEQLAALDGRAVVLCFDQSIVPPTHEAIEMPQGAGDYARRLYNALRDADGRGAERIIIITPPDSNEMWKAVHDRLMRATSGSH